MKTMDNYNFSGKKALIRVDFNVPLDEHFNITDDTRIRAALPTINKILKDGGTVVLMSHLGRPKNGPEKKFSLKHIVTHLSTCLHQEVIFLNDCVGKDIESKVNTSRTGSVILLENLRFHPEETKGDKTFAEQLSKLGDVYVNDAFGTAHRAHASTTIVADFFPQDKLFGYLIQGELNSIDKVLKNGKKPLTAIMGGAKVSSKITIINKLLDKIDNLIIGGGMSYTFVKAQGGKVGSSLVEEDKLGLAIQIMEDAKKKNVKLYIPIDTIIADQFSNEAQKKECAINEIPDGWMGLDIGKETEKIYTDVILNSATILWNGPMGVFEMSNFEDGTKCIAKTLVKATQEGAFTLIGGGDSVAAINKYHLADQVSYVSTGGGALLEYLEGKTLPGIQAIQN